MNAPALEADGIALGCERAPQRLIGVQLHAVLVEANDPEALRAFDLSGVGGQRARQEVEERRLAAAVRPHEADAHAAGDGEIEILDEPTATEGLRQTPRDEKVAGPSPGRGEVNAGDAGRAAGPGVAELLDQAARFLDATLRLGRAGLGAATEPLDLAPDGIGERFLVGDLALQEFVAPREELAVPPVALEQARRVGAVQLEHARGHVLQEVPVVADDEAGSRPFREERLQPEDALDVEVVRWLIHEQDVRLGRELARDRQAFLPSPGEHGDLLAPTREPCAAEGLGDATRTVGIIHGGQCRRHHVLHGAPSREGRVLRHVTDPHSAAERAPAAVGRLDPGEDLQKGGLAGPVRAHEPHLVPFEEPERQLVEEGPGAVSLADRLTTQKERPGHAELFRLARLSRDIDSSGSRAQVPPNLRRIEPEPAELTKDEGGMLLREILRAVSRDRDLDSLTAVVLVAGLLAGLED